MILKEEYDISLAKLEEKEKLKLLAIENGKNFIDLYNKTLQQAKDERKHIFILFYMKGCDGCNVVRYLIDNDDQVKNYLNKYLVLTCDVSQTKTHLNQRYNLYSYPACFIIDCKENILKQKMGISVVNGANRDLINWIISK